jgi:hypothetical protein
MVMKASCLCGAVRVTVSAEPFFVGKCYCTDCQKESGGGHNTVVVVPDAGLNVSGETRGFGKMADSGATVVRHFCPKCGTTLYAQSETVPGASALRAGTLDEAPPITLEMAIYWASAASWDEPPANIPHVPGSPRAEV